MIGGCSQALESSSRTCESFKRIKVGRVAVALSTGPSSRDDGRQGPTGKSGKTAGRARYWTFGRNRVGRERNLAVERMDGGSGVVVVCQHSSADADLIERA